MKKTKLSNGMNFYVKSMGKIFRVTHVVPDADTANLALEQDPDTALIAVDNNGLHYLAEQYGAICPSAILKDI